MKATVLVVLLSVLGVAYATNDTWTVMSQHIMTISMGLDFTTPQIGLVSGTANGVGPEIKRTTDAGQTWVDVEHETAFLMYMCMAFTDTQRGVTAGMGMDRFAASSAYTTDGGMTWTLTDDRNIFATYQDCEPVPSVSGMIVMPGVWADIFGSSGQGVAISMNGGRDFAHHDWQIDTEPRYAHFGSASVGWISGGTWPEDEYDSQLFYRRSMRSGFILDGDEHVHHKILPRSNRMAGVEGFIGVIANTKDGGNTWNVQFNDTGRLYFNGIWAVDVNNVWAVAEGDEGAWIFHTSNGGASWVQQLFVADASMITVKFFDKNEGWVAGGAAVSKGMAAGMWHTVDGGNTWELMTIKNYYVNDLDLLDRDHVYATAFSKLGDSAVLQYTPAQ